MNDMDKDPLAIDDYTAPAQPTASDTSSKPGRKTARATIPGVKVIVHPECQYEVVQAADEVGSTEKIIATIAGAPVRAAAPLFRWRK